MNVLYINSYGETAKMVDIKCLSASRSVSRQKSDDSVDSEFVADLSELLESVSMNPDVDCQVDMIKHLYSSQMVAEYRQSGVELAELLFSGLDDPNYRMPNAEKRFIDRNKDVFSAVIPPQMTMISFGCGPYAPVLTKDIVFARAIDAKEYVAIDINKDQAKRAAELVTERVGIKSSYICTDFTSPFALVDKKKEEAPFIATMWGCTLSQFPPSSYSCGKGEISLGDFLNNLSTITSGRAIFIATIDSNKVPHETESEYSGPGMRKFMQYLWWRAKDVVDNASFDPEAFSYKPYFDAEKSAILHSYLVVKNTQAVFGDKTYDIPKGASINIGYSARNVPEEIEGIALENGWQPIRLPFNYDSTIRAVALVGKNVSPAWKDHLAKLNV